MCVCASVITGSALTFITGGRGAGVCCKGDWAVSFMRLTQLKQQLNVLNCGIRCVYLTHKKPFKHLSFVGEILRVVACVLACLLAPHLAKTVTAGPVQSSRIWSRSSTTSLCLARIARAEERVLEAIQEVPPIKHVLTARGVPKRFCNTLE